MKFYFIKNRENNYQYVSFGQKNDIMSRHFTYAFKFLSIRIDVFDF